MDKEKSIHEACLDGFQDAKLSMETLSSLLLALKNSNRQQHRCLHDLFTRIYRVSENTCRVSIPPSFQHKVSKWLGGDPSMLQAVNTQTVVHVFNNILGHGTLFNPLRQKRPKPSNRGDTLKQIEELVGSQSQANCDFCNYKLHTADEPGLGKLENSSAYSFANVFKLSGWHSIIAFREHHPLMWSDKNLSAGFELADQWFQKAHNLAPDCCYPMAIWDNLPGAGASQIHPHIHVLLASQQYYGIMEQWTSQMKRYQDTYHTDYLADVTQLSASLGLVTTVGGAHAMPSLTPQYNHEILLRAENTGADLFRLIYYLIKVFFEKLGLYGFSFGIVYPPMGDKVSPQPVYARLVSRPPIEGVKSDISGYNVHAAPEIDSDPFRLAEVVQSYVNEMKKTGTETDPVEH